MQPLVALVVFSLITLLTPSSWAGHAFSLYDTPRYPADFSHFEYHNPNATKGGEIYLANPGAATSFDKFNPFSMKGVAAAGLSNLMFESLAIGSADEVAT